MNLDEYQTEALKTAIYKDCGNNLYYPTLLMAAETGEISNIVQKIMRDKKDILFVEDQEKLAKEAGDVLWALAAFCHEIGYDLSEVAEININKLRDRQTRGTIMGSGDDR